MTETDVLRDIIAGIAKKGDSVFRCYSEILTSNDFVTLSGVKRIADKYSVPELYEDHINKRFQDFKTNLKTVCRINHEKSKINVVQGFHVDKWKKGGVQMFGSTESITITKAGGLETMCREIHSVGYFEYLMKIFKESAIDVSKRKYSSLIMTSEDMIEHKR